MKKPVFIKKDQLNKIKKNKNIKIVDIFEEQLEELFEVLKPEFLYSSNYKNEKRILIKNIKNGKVKVKDCWVFFPWNGKLVHCLGKNELELLLTNRNKDLINSDEQKKLKEFTVGVIGMSIGSHMAECITGSGISELIKISDFDTLSTANLNRINSGIDKIGEKKTEVASQKIYSRNPFQKIEIFDKGLNDGNVEKFFVGSKKVDLIFEAIDDFKMKIKLRVLAKKNKTAIVMLTNLGDSVLVDVERYDIESGVKIFNGLIGDLAEEILTKDLTPEVIKKYAIEIVGRENVPPRAIDSLGKIGKTLVGRPQLLSTVTVAGGLSAYIARKIALGENLPSGRRKIIFEKLLNYEF